MCWLPHQSGQDDALSVERGLTRMALPGLLKGTFERTSTDPTKARSLQHLVVHGTSDEELSKKSSNWVCSSCYNYDASVLNEARPMRTKCATCDDEVAGLCWWQAGRKWLCKSCHIAHATTRKTRARRRPVLLASRCSLTLRRMRDCLMRETPHRHEY
jgi:hypothetical protein